MLTPRVISYSVVIFDLHMRMESRRMCGRGFGGERNHMV